MTYVFADTFYFVALLSPSDRAHKTAQSLAVNKRWQLVTTAWVITELANSLSKRTTRSAFLATYEALRNSPNCEIVVPSQQLFDRGVELYAARPDKNWSLTDCISFVVMQERGITDALTGDRHFVQAGFRALLVK